MQISEDSQSSENGMPPDVGAVRTAGESSETKQTVPQIVLSDGLPPAVGAVAAMAIVGAPPLLILAAGFFSALGFTLLRKHAQA